MSLYIAKSLGSTTYELATVEIDLVSISNMDDGIGFEDVNTVVIEGVTCEPVTYARTLTGPTSVRLDALVHDTGFVSSQQIIVIGVTSAATLPDGTAITSVGGMAFPIGSLDSPFASHICTMYDTGLCNDTGYWVDEDGGGKTCMPRAAILYHELAHCFHYATGVASTEPLAEVDENDMRDVLNVPHRDVSSHNGGCGAPDGCDSCCIVASLSTGSPYSNEIKRFRHVREHSLRGSKVGNNFFKEFHYNYYGFSPEITSLMGHQTELKPLIRERLVMPLLSGVEMLIHYADNQGQGLVQFLRGQSAREDLAGIYKKDFLDQLSGYLMLAGSLDAEAISSIIENYGEEYAGFTKLLQYIHAETLKNEYVAWSLLAVVDVWVKSASLLYSEKTDAEIDSEIYNNISGWIGLMPISDIWDEFSRIETEFELQYLERFIFEPASKKVFSERLIEKHPRYRETIVNWAEGKRG